MRARTTAAAMALGLITTAWLLEHLSLAHLPRLDRFVRGVPRRCPSASRRCWRQASSTA